MATDDGMILDGLVSSGKLKVQDLTDEGLMSLADYRKKKTAIQPPDSTMMGSMSQAEADTLNAGIKEPDTVSSLAGPLSKAWLDAENAKTSPNFRQFVAGVGDSAIGKTMAGTEYKRQVAQIPEAQGVAQNISRMGGTMLLDAPLYEAAGTVLGKPVAAAVGKLGLTGLKGAVATAAARGAAEVAAVTTAENIKPVVTGEKKPLEALKDVGLKTLAGGVGGGLIGAAGYLPTAIGNAVSGNAAKALQAATVNPNIKKAKDFIIRDAPKASRGSIAARADAYIMDELAPLAKLSAEAKKQGIVPDILSDPHRMARLSRGYGGAATEAITGQGLPDLATGTTKVLAPSLEKILAPLAKTELDDYGTYEAMRRLKSYRPLGLDPGIEEAVIDDAIKTFGSPKFQAVFDENVNWRNELFKQLRDSGYLSAKDFTDITAKNPDYVKIERVMDAVVNGMPEGSGVGKAFGNLRNPVQKRVGSTTERAVYDPIQTDIKLAHTTYNTVARQKVDNALLNVARKGTGLESLIEEIPNATGELAKQNIIRVKDQGVEKFLKLDPELYRAVMDSDGKTAGILGDVLNTINVPLKGMKAMQTGFNAPFAILTNPSADNFTAPFYSKNGYIPFVDMVRGMKSVLTKDEAFRRFQASGGSQSGILSLDRNTVKQQVAQLSAKIKSPAYYLTHPFEGIRAIADVMENATRVGDYARSPAAKPNATPAQIAEGALGARDLTQDFANLGSATRQLNKVYAFLGAKVGGVERFTREMRTNPVQATAKGIAVFTVPGVLSYLKFKDKPEYQQLSEVIKDTSLVVGFVPYKGKEYPIAIPMVRGPAGIAFYTIPMLALRAANGDLTAKRALETAGKRTVGEMLPSSFTPSLVAPLADIKSNYASYADRPIVPESEADMPAAQQFGTYTSETAKEIGKVLNMSPRQIDYLIGGYLGGTGKQVAGLLDMAIDGLAKDGRPTHPASTPADWFMVNKVISDPFSQPSSVDEVYKRLGELRPMGRALKAKTGTMTPTERNELDKLETTARNLTELRNRIQKVYESKNIDPAVKRTQIDDLQKRIAQTAAVALQKTPEDRLRTLNQFK